MSNYEANQHPESPKTDEGESDIVAEVRNLTFALLTEMGFPVSRVNFIVTAVDTDEGQKIEYYEPKH